MACEDDPQRLFDSLSLDGYIFSATPDDPADCFAPTKTHDSYNTTEVIMVQIDGRYYPLHLCGSTNTGLWWDGCHHGVFGGAAVDPLDPFNSGCGIQLTGEVVSAQACVLPCSGYVIDTTFKPVVLVAKIKGQWFIVSVLDGFNLASPGRKGCEGFCCDLGGGDINAHLSGCSLWDGETILLQGDGLSWSGSKTKSGVTLSIAITCDDLVPPDGDWEVIVTCDNGSQVFNPEVVCGGTGSGSATTGGHIAGVTTNVCTCGTVNIGFSPAESTKQSRCTEPTRTGTIVDARACGLPDLRVNDLVIMAQFTGRVDGPGTGTGSETGSGTGTGTGLVPELQYHIISACAERYDCEPCPPPPPPPELDCCGFDTETVPQGLVAIATFGYTNDQGCVCHAELTIFFDLVEGSNPPEWTQSPGLVLCPSGSEGSSTGTGVDGSVFLGFSGLRIQCSGGTGTGTETGTGSSASLFFLTDGNCNPPGIPVGSSNDSCSPLYMEFDYNGNACCDANTNPDFELTIHLEVTAA